MTLEHGIWERRASELFDWLRALPDGHELGPLCDVYTYTTLISQCGSHQQLRKALELVAEMRGRGIACNVHTYSALMNVCIKVSVLHMVKHCIHRQSSSRASCCKSTSLLSMLSGGCALFFTGEG